MFINGKQTMSKTKITGTFSSVSHGPFQQNEIIVIQNLNTKKNNAVKIRKNTKAAARKQSRVITW